MDIVATSRGTTNGEDGQISSSTRYSYALFPYNHSQKQSVLRHFKSNNPTPSLSQNYANNATVHTIYIERYLRRRHPRSGRGRSFPAPGLPARKVGCRRPGSSWRLRRHPSSWGRQECGTRSAQERRQAQPRRGIPATPPLGHPPADRNDIQYTTASSLTKFGTGASLFKVYQIIEEKSGRRYYSHSNDSGKNPNQINEETSCRPLSFPSSTYFLFLQLYSPHSIYLLGVFAKLGKATFTSIFYCSVVTQQNGAKFTLCN